MLEDEQVAALALELHAGGLGRVAGLEHHLAEGLADEDLVGAGIGLHEGPGLLVRLLRELDHRREPGKQAHVVDRRVGDPGPEDDRSRLGAARDILLDLLILLGLREVVLEHRELVAELGGLLLGALDLVGAVDVRRGHREHHELLAVALRARCPGESGAETPATDAVAQRAKAIRFSDFMHTSHREMLRDSA